jgi:hypothetical protein
MEVRRTTESDISIWRTSDAARCRTTGKFVLRWFQVLAWAGVLTISALAAGNNAAPESGPRQRAWGRRATVYSGPYEKPCKACAEFRSKDWVDHFFEMGRTGCVQDKAQMVAKQSAADNPLGIGPHPDAFTLRAVYGDFAVATDIPSLTTVEPGGQPTFTSCAKVLRLFIEERGEWRPAGAAQSSGASACGSFRRSSREEQQLD